MHGKFVQKNVRQLQEKTFVSLPQHFKELSSTDIASLLGNLVFPTLKFIVKTRSFVEVFTKDKREEIQSFTRGKTIAYFSWAGWKTIYEVNFPSSAGLGWMGKYFLPII